MTIAKPAHKRILLKLSGEALMGDDQFGINRATIVRMVEEIADVTRLGVQVAVVIGGGNIFRGVAGGAQIATYLHGTRIGVLVEYEGKDTAAKDVAMHVAAMKPVALTSNDVPAELIEKERSVATAKAAESGKPADIAAKMIEGSVQKYLKEVSLNNQTFVKNDKQTVEQMLKAEATQVKAFTLYVVGEGIEKKVDDFAAEVAAQVAAAQNAA